MSETIKVVIEISKDYYEILKSEVEGNETDYYPFVVIGNGIPLDSVKAEIEKLPNANPSYWHSGDMVEREEVLEILDNIGKAVEDD